MSMDYCRYALQVLKYGEELQPTLTKSATTFQSILEFSAENHIFWTKTLINYREIISLTFSRKRAMICEFFATNLSNSCLVVYGSVSIVFNNYWSFGH